MNSSALGKFEPCRPAPRCTEVSVEPASVSARPDLHIKRGRQNQVSAEAARIPDDIRRAILCNPKTAQAATRQLLRIIARLTEVRPISTRGGLTPWQKRKVDHYLSEHLCRPLYTREIANQVSLSVSHFARAFRQSYGRTPHMHIIALRLELAQQLMLTTEHPLSQIALVCGMADQSHLSKLFLRGVGDTPGAWRRRHLRDADPGTSAATDYQHQAQTVPSLSFGKT